MDAPITTAVIHKWIGISLESWLTIAAVVVGPILALMAQRVLDSIRETHNRQLHVFRELMITRSLRLSPRHVEALNAVPLEFKDKGKDVKTIAAWKAYLLHLGTDSSKDYGAWTKTGAVLLIDLLFEMSKRVGFKIEKLRIETEIYLPQFFNVLETEQNALRKELLEVLNGTGSRKIPVAVFEQKFPDIELPDLPNDK